MSIDSAKPPADTLRADLTVPWDTVLPLAIVLAYADGFWMVTLRGAVGAIERTQEPFTGWLRESTLTVPLFVFAVLGALTLALRWFGPVLRTPGAGVGTALLIVAAGTVVGMAQIVVSSVYDYYLESDQMTMMNSMHGLCVGSCLEQAQQSTFAAVVRAVLYTAGFILLSNLVLVGWLLAMRGGRLEVTATGNMPDDAPNRHRGTGGRRRDLPLLVAAGLFGSAVVHAAVVPDHLAEWPAAGAFFVLLAVADVTVAVLLLTRPHRTVLLAVAALSIGPLLLWLCSRTVGLPVGPAAGQPEPVGVPDIVCCVLEIVTLVAAGVLLRRDAGRPAPRPAASAHVRWLTLVAVVAATCIGLAGCAPAWFEGSAPQSDTTMSH